MTVKSNFIREHASKEALQTIEIEMYIFICLLLKKELDKISQKDRTSS